jgi:hypothetical protein
VRIPPSSRPNSNNSSTRPHRGCRPARIGTCSRRLGFQRVLQRAVFHVQSSGKKEVTVANVLVAIFSEKQSHAAYLLSMQDVSRLDVVNFIAHGLSKAGGEERSEREEGGAAGDAERDGDGGGNALEKYATNLNDAARKGKIDPLIGRKLEVERTIEILCRRRKNNPLYVGEAGVGKTAIAEGLARMIVENQVPDVLLDATIYSAGHGLAGRRHEISRRLREAFEGSARRSQEAARCDSLHRRDSHRHRRRCGFRRRHGRLEPHQAGPRQRRIALHRLDHLQRVSRNIREGPCAGAALSRRSTSPSRPSRTRWIFCAGSRLATKSITASSTRTTPCRPRPNSRRVISMTGTCRTRRSTWWMRPAPICGCGRWRIARPP